MSSMAAVLSVDTRKGLKGVSATPAAVTAGGRLGYSAFTIRLEERAMDLKK